MLFYVSINWGYCPQLALSCSAAVFNNRLWKDCCLKYPGKQTLPTLIEVKIPLSISKRETIDHLLKKIKTTIIIQTIITFLLLINLLYLLDFVHLYSAD